MSAVPRDGVANEPKLGSGADGLGLEKSESDCFGGGGAENKLRMSSFPFPGFEVGTGAARTGFSSQSRSKRPPPRAVGAEGCAACVGATVSVVGAATGAARGAGAGDGSSDKKSSNGFDLGGGAAALGAVAATGATAGMGAAPVRTDGLAGGGPGKAQRRLSYLLRMKLSILWSGGI